MSVRFAGSRRVDERRRRNLATQSEAPVKPRRSTRRSAKQVQKEETSGESDSARYFPVKKLVSRRKWKLSLIALGLISVCCSLFYLSTQIQDSPGNWPPAVNRFLSLENGLLYRSLNCLIVFLSAQLALGIWWARSRSLHDFTGQYRTWFTVSMIGMMISFCMATDAHQVFSGLITWYWRVQFWKQELLCWVVPLMGCATAAVWSMHIELRKNRLTLILFWISMLLWGSSLAFSFDAGEEVLAEQFVLAKTTTLTGGSIFLFLSLLYHTQFVVYVDSDPPEARMSLRQRLLEKLKIRKAKKEEKAKEKAKRKAEKVSAKKSVAKKTTTTSRKTKSKTTTSASKTVKKEPEPVQTQSRKSQPKAAKKKQTQNKPTQAKQVEKKQPEKKPTAEKQTTSTNTESFNIQDYQFEPGEPLDQELLKGLSKRERRQLRKRWKQSQSKAA